MNFNPLKYSVLFKKPLRLAPSGWIGHIPLGMALVDFVRPMLLVELGTHHGVSYCCFCQIVRELDLDTQCFAIDTWQGDPQAGLYGPEVLADLKAHHDPLYSKFSTLIQSTFDEARSRFSDHSIDLLHIDGFHTYDAVAHDFESWLPKVSDRGVVIMHDIGVRDGDFGVWKLWAELCQRFPHFEFQHSNGLGLLAVGKGYPESLNFLFQSSEADASAIRDLFAALGARWSTESALAESEKKLHAQAEGITFLTKVRKQNDETIAAKDEAIKWLTEAHAEDEKSIREKDQSVEWLNKQRQQLQVDYDTVKKNEARAVMELESVSERLEAAKDELRVSAAQLSKQDHRISTMRDQIFDLERQLVSQTDRTSALQALLATTEASLANHRDLEKARILTRKELLQWVGSTSRSRTQLFSAWENLRSRRRFRGMLEAPTEGVTINDQSLQIKGWLYSTAGPITQVGAFLDDVPLGQLTFGEQRLDLEGLSDPSSVANCGFSGTFSLDEFPPGDRTLIVRAIDAEGNFNELGHSITVGEPSTTLDNQTESISASSDGHPSLTAVPDQVPVGKIIGTTQISWDTGDGSDGDVYVSVNGETESLFASGSSGSQPAPWIIAGSTYTFRLYSVAAEKQLLKEAIAKGTTIPAPKTQAAPVADQLSAIKHALKNLADISLQAFLNSNSVVEFPAVEQPEVSIILVLYNRAELTLQCLNSILQSDLRSYEVVIVDNASVDQTPRLLDRIRGARIIRNEANLHFLRAVNQAARQATGEHLLLLNNDARLLTGSVASALQTLKSSPNIGAVGGKIILSDGSLQEAGSIIWRDGSCLGYGRGDSPSDPAFMFRRDVDYCSAAFLLTPRSLFLAEGGFDEDYAPAYYEETDYCVRLWKKGLRVVYEPNAVILHYEFASSASQDSAIQLQLDNRKIFVSKHAEWLRSQFDPAESLLWARNRASQESRSILFMDDRVPHVALGSGFPRSNRILWELQKLGHTVTFYPTTAPREDWSQVYADIPPEVEVMLDHGWERAKAFFSRRAGYYDVVIISRPHNMASFKSIMAEAPDIRDGAKIVYDAEAIFGNREIAQSQLAGKVVSAEEEAKLIGDEVALARNCDIVVSVSDKESKVFSEHGCKEVRTLAHSLEVHPSDIEFDAREHILFVGAIHSIDSPNADSMIWFAEEILPLIKRNHGLQLKLLLAGLCHSDLRHRIANDQVRFLGRVDDLTPIYDAARIFVAPTRFSAGIPLKICEAAAHGLPIVATRLAGNQLGWSHEQELLLADDPNSFAEACVRLYSDADLWTRLRRNMLSRVKHDFSAEKFANTLKEIID